MRMSEFKRITHIFLSVVLNNTLIIAINIARKKREDIPKNVIVEEMNDGIYKNTGDSLVEFG